MKLIDLSQTIEAGMSLFSEKAPQPSIHPWMSHSQAAASGNYEDCSCEVTVVNMVTSLGTYLDSPYHFFPGGDSIESLHLEQLILEHSKVLYTIYFRSVIRIHKYKIPESKVFPDEMFQLY